MKLKRYLRLTGIKLGYLLNFGDALMKNGISKSTKESFESVSVSLWLCENRSRQNYALPERGRRRRSAIVDRSRPPRERGR